jgi:hypothetical protein
MNSAIVYLIDHSGSMQGYWKATIDGLNKFVEYQQSRMDDAVFYMAEFDTVYRLKRDWISIFDMPPLKADLGGQWGETAMYDAIEKAVDETEKMMDKLPPNERPVNITFVVQGDGGDNSSRHASKERCARIIADRPDWSFVFLAANQWAAQAAKDAGFQHVIEYAQSRDGSIEGFDDIAKSILEAIVTGTLKGKKS